MSAAPSRLSWEEWSSVHLDRIEPVKENDESQISDIPQFWKGQLLSWDQLEGRELPVTLTGNKLVVAKDGNQRHWLYSVGGITAESRISNSSTNCTLLLILLEVYCHYRSNTSF